MPQVAASPINVGDAHTARPSLAGRRAIITGGTTGIGLATAILLATEGVHVFICGRAQDHLDDARARIREVGEGDGISVDLAEHDGVARFFEAADRFLGGLDVAVINAAVSANAIADTDEPDLTYQIATDFTAYLQSAKAALDRMKTGGDLILIGSMSAVSQGSGSSVYVAAKTGIQGFARSLRGEMAERDIKVGLIEPGFTGTDMHYPDYPPEKQRALIHEERMLRAEDIGVAVHFMLTQPRRTAVSHMRVEPRLPHS